MHINGGGAAMVKATSKPKESAMTTAEAAAELRCTSQTILNAIHAGLMAATRVGVGSRGKLVIDRAEFERYKRSRLVIGQVFGPGGGDDYLSRKGRRA